MSRLVHLSSASLLSALAFGCGTQASTSYRGEPLATISGTVTTGAQLPASALPSSIDAALVWAQVQLNANSQLVQAVSWVGESTPVTGQLPAKFTLNVYQPPPSGATIPCPSSSAHIAVSFIVAVDGTVDLSQVDVRSAVVGEANDFMLLYLDSDQAAGWSCLPDMGFTYSPTQGYHLMQEVPNSVQPRAGGAKYPAYVEAPNGLQTQVTVTLGETTLPTGTPGQSTVGSGPNQPPSDASTHSFALDAAAPSSN